jgi:hypothetical protein
MGKTETEAELTPINTEWTLCLTAFDVSSLPVSQRIIGNLLIRNLSKSLMGLHYRVRPSVENTYYQDTAWIRSLETAGKSLAAKRNERDLLIYKGYPDWRYNNEVKTINAAIITLEEAYRKAEEALIQVTPAPVFKLTTENIGGNFPAPPAAGTEYRFCTGQKADAFVSGEISEFHGRIFLLLRMYTLYTRSFEYEDSFIFSADDIGMIEEEMTGRMMAAISGAPSSAISVKADPAEAVILIRESFAAQGDTGIMEYPPGSADVAVFAEGYTGGAVSVDLEPGELTELQFTLKPVPTTPFDIIFPGYNGTPVYQGALYLGNAPLSVSAPRNQFEYIHAETPGGDTAAVIFRAGHTGNVISLPIAIPSVDDPTPLGTARRKYYGAWGRFWIALPVAIIISGIATSYKNAYLYQEDPAMGEKYQIYNAVSIGAWAAFGVITAESLYRIFRYTRTASKSVPVMAK